MKFNFSITQTHIKLELIEIIALNRWNWEEFLEIKIEEEQAKFIPSVLFSIAQSKFENLTPYGLVRNQQPVGFLMYGNLSGIIWINRILIDKKFQKQGIATQVLSQLLPYLAQKFPNTEIRTSCDTHNYPALQLFQKAGFVAINEALPDEIVLKWETFGN